jgi:O-antigen ligase
MPLVFYWVARHVEFTDRGIKYLFGAMAVLGVYLAFTAVCEAKYKWAFVFPRYIVSPTFKEWLGRGRGPLLNPAGNGILMSISLACGLAFWPQQGRAGKVFLAAIFTPMLMLGIYYTLTRSAWMGGAAALLVMMAAYLPRQWRVSSVTAVLAVSLVYTAANWESLLSFKRDKELTAADTADSASLRPILAYVATRMFLDQPIFGWGLGHYLNECPPYLADRSVDLPLAKVRPYVQHNAVLSMLVETGLLGGTMYLLVMYLWVREAWRLWHKLDASVWQRQAGVVFLAIFAAYFANAMFQDTTIIPMIHLMLFFFAAVVLSILQSPLAPPRIDTSHRDQLSAEVEREWFGQPRALEHV